MARQSIRHLCQEAAVSIKEAYDFVHYPAQNAELLGGFWGVQDQLTRLVEAACDDPDDVFDILREEHRQLFQDVIGVLSSASRAGLTRNAAISTSCEAINQLLTKLEMLKLSRAKVAAL